MSGQSTIELPKRTLGIEFLVGLFTIAGVIAAGALAVGLGGITFFNSDSYTVTAEFDNISGLQTGASVEIAGVPIGQIQSIVLKDSAAVLTLAIHNNVKLRDDDIAQIRTKGIIGDRYVKISRGGSATIIPPGGKLSETESVVDFEDIIGKVVHILTGDKDSTDSKDSKNSKEK
jgi:phospholipid/cholesterol/gamma-HCH transport system substrate-binding protein